MDEAEKLSALIGSIYDTSLDPSLWPAVLKESARFECGWSGALFAKDAASKAGEIYYNDGVIDAQHTELYFSKYVRLDPFTTAHFFAEIGEPIASAIKGRPGFARRTVRRDCHRSSPISSRRRSICQLWR